MNGLSAFAYACGGGLTAAFIAYVLPDFVKLAEDESYVFVWRNLWRKVPVSLALAVLAGTFYVTKFHAPNGSSAYYAGLGVQAAIKGTFTTVREVAGALIH